METLNVRVVKDKYNEIKDGKIKILTVNLTDALTKKIAKNGKSTKDEMIADKSLIKEFDQICILCMLSSDSITIPIDGMTLNEDGILFVLKNDTKENETEKNDKVVPEKIEPKEEEKKKEEKIVDGVEKKIVYENENNFEKRILETIDNFCKNKKVFTVNGPRVAIHPNGVVFGTGRTLPILNDVRFYIDIEKQKFYFTYDMSEDEFVEQLNIFLKKMLVNNFVFIWKNKCEYKEVDGKRFLILYYTTRRYINQTKKLL